MRRSLYFAAAILCGVPSLFAQSAPIALSVDLTDAPRRILYATETLPVKPGELTLVYPKWIPGEHSPSGPIDQSTGLVMTTDTGLRVKWERDDVNMFAYHLTVPAGATSLTVKMEFLATAAAQGFSAGASTSANLALLSWNSVLLYPAGAKAADVQFVPTLRIPAEWKFGTALEMSAKPEPNVTLFKTVSLEQLIDSPVLAGRWFREIRLAPDTTPQHILDLAGDGPEDLALSEEHIQEFTRLVHETGALYKSRHYGEYHFLVTLSDQVAHFGLEHHQSSDDRVAHQTFSDDSQFVANGLLLPHEFTHSWNGKYRRPAGLATGDYDSPMKGDLLWVYEGLTEYLGDVLTSRSGIWSPEVYRDRLATVYGYLNDARQGRTWRDLQDTATAAQLLYSAGGAYDAWRRNVDYYDEGELLWLEVDLTIREKTNGARSLNDFAAAFEGVGGNTGPKVVPYTFDDVVKGLNAVCPNDWAGFLRVRLDSNDLHVPEQKGLDALSGYKLVYTDQPNYWSQLLESSGYLDARYSLGLMVGSTGSIGDVLFDSLAFKAGLAPGFQIVAVNGRAFSTGLLRAAIQEAKTTQKPIELIVENTGYYKVVRLEYHDGERYPSLERVDAVPDRLSEILKPMTPAK
ncbi:MAG: M61 family peptidase [Acidobacteriaceae bacterium]|nr:M61 family peptidase [Acidobacteriaceae bacterium]